MHLRNLLTITDVQHDLILLPTPQALRKHIQTTLETHLATARQLRLALGIILADLGTTMLRGMTRPIIAETTAPHIMKATLETSTTKADLVLDIRPTTPNPVGKFFILRSTGTGIDYSTPAIQ